MRKIDADDEAGYFERAWACLADAGFEQYEVSNYSRPGQACVHNLNTWRMQEWVGYGPSASSQLGLRRWTEPHSLEEWLTGLGGGPGKLADEVDLTPSILAQDYLVFGLRMNEGVDLDQWQRRFPEADLTGWPSFQDQLVSGQLAVLEGSQLRLTDAGRLVADRIGEEILGLG